jgi:hypothetical protein
MSILGSAVALTKQRRKLFRFTAIAFGKYCTELSGYPDILVKRSLHRTSDNFL